MTNRRQRQPASDETPHAILLSGLVRGLHRYFRTVRPRRSVRHRSTSLDFPMRPSTAAALGGCGISRFPREVFPYVLGVGDRAGLWHSSRYRCTRWGLRHLLTASASRSNSLRRLNTRPVRSLVTASLPPSQAAPHDSGLGRYFTFVRLFHSLHLAALAGVQGESKWAPTLDGIFSGRWPR